MGRVASPYVPDDADRQLLRLLLAGGPVSGEEMSRELNMTRAAVWKRIAHLREMGYDIESAPRKGYWLAGDVLKADAVLARLHTRWLGHTLICEPVVDSTFKLMRDLESAGCPDGTVAAAGQQTEGRGRMNRRWASPPDTGLYFNVLLRPNLPTVQAVRLTPAIAVGVCHALRNLGFDAKIKWPNDIVISGRKVCGMLLEMGGDLERLKFISAGIGINVLQKLEDFPEDLREKAGSLALACGKGFSLTRTDVLCACLSAIEQAVELCYADYPALLEEYRALSITIGSEIVASGGSDLRGTAININENGELLVRDAAGEVHVLRTGDVSVRGVMGYV